MIKRRNRTTNYISFNPHLCKACWQCLAVCPAGVFAKIDLPFHKHIRIDHPELCKGCQKCLQVCPEKALNPL